MGLPPSPRSAIPITPACTARSRCAHRAGTRRCRSIVLCAHPAMPEFARMYRESRPRWFMRWPRYRDRSHFDGQDVLESGFAGPGRVDPAGSTGAGSVAGRRSGESALAVGPTTPLVLRGAAPTSAGRRSRCRRPPTIPRCGLPISIAIAIRRSRRRWRKGLQLDKAAHGDDMRPKPGANAPARCGWWRAARPN